METRYTVLNKISETIYGAIYKAHDNKMDCDVALKLSHAEQGLKRGEDPLGEIGILDELSNSPEEHEGKQYIIRLHDKFSTKLNDALYYCTALEFTGGGDLLGRILEMANIRRQLSFSQIRRYFVMLAKGLGFIHKHGISHLDLSLENILLTHTDEIRICDFGQSERSQTVHDTDLRRGKPKYMSPEIYQLLKYDGFKSDVWSLGVVLWGLITGGLIFKKPSYSDPRFSVLAKGQEGIIKLLQVDEVIDVPPLLIDLLTKMLEINPKNRCTIEEVLAHPWVTTPCKSVVTITPNVTLTEIQISGEAIEQKSSPSPASTSSTSSFSSLSSDTPTSAPSPTTYPDTPSSQQFPSPFPSPTISAIPSPTIDAIPAFPSPSTTTTTTTLSTPTSSTPTITPPRPLRTFTFISTTPTVKTPSLQNRIRSFWNQMKQRTGGRDSPTKIEDKSKEDFVTDQENNNSNNKNSVNQQGEKVAFKF